MNANTQITAKPFIVTRDGEVDKKLSTFEPRRVSVTAFTGHVALFRANMHLQAEMALYDLLHGTHYRRIHRKLHRERRNQAFEKRIGLERV